MVATTRNPAIEPDTPDWFKRFALKLADFYVSRSPSQPLKLPAYPSTDRPDATKFEGCLIYYSDTGDVARSNGTTWGVL